MRILSVYLKEGLYERKINFTDSVNLIHSSQNSCGKTTLMRFILYGLGYPVPNTKKIKFEKCEIIVELQTETIGYVKIERYSRDFIEVTNAGKKHTYLLPEALKEFHSKLFATTNEEILNSIVGAFYTDQEKGWTLLNRGRVIGDIRFNIDELLRGLGGKDGTSLIEKQKKVEQEILKYKSMYSIAQYRDSVALAGGNLSYDNSLDKLDIEIQQLMLEKEKLVTQRREVAKALSDNKALKKYIEKLKIMVEDDNGNRIQVTSKNIVGLEDEINLHKAHIKLLASRIVGVEKELEDKVKSAAKDNEQLAFFTSDTLKNIFDKRIATLPINQIAIKNELDQLNLQLSNLKKALNERSRINNQALTSLYNNILKYADELGINTNSTFTQNYVFTKNLKELTGAVLHKTVFAFRLGYILAIEKELKIKLPILIDSPRSGEVDDKNIQLMMNILRRDFADHQIIIASIFDYDFHNINRIELKNVLIDEPVDAIKNTVIENQRQVLCG